MPRTDTINEKTVPFLLATSHVHIILRDISNRNVTYCTFMQREYETLTDNVKDSRTHDNVASLNFETEGSCKGRIKV
jgi:hypothetical protein